ncbi:MAG TPA: alpha/beta hydrolase family protein [Polyangiales bacterium]
MARSVFEPWVARTSARLARGVDDLFCSTALNPPKLMRRRSSAEGLGHAERMQALAAIGAFYARSEHLEPEASFFPTPAPIHPTITARRALGASGEVVDLRWPSAFKPLWSRASMEEALASASGEPAQPTPSDLRELRFDRSGELADKYLRAVRNQTCHARWYRHHGGGRPCAVILHGYMAGAFAMEERIWDVPKLFRMGLDVLITVLPFHGPRRSERRGFLPPAFPSNDPRFTIEGFRQVMFDHQAVFAYLRREGVGELGLMGTSLGGYAAALLATLEPALAFTVLFIPLASTEDFARRHGRFIGTAEEQDSQYRALQTAQWVVSPFARPPKIASERVLVIAGGSDLVTGAHDAQRLAQHFSAPTVTFPGGHLLHFGRGQAFEAAHALLRRHGLAE